MSEQRMDKRSGVMLQGFLSLAVMVFVIVSALVVANWLPGTIDNTLMRQYPDIDEVRQKLRMRTVFVPSYFPETMSWPPSKVLAQARPYEAVVIEFVGSESGELLLVISQSTSGAFMPFERLRMEEVAERSIHEFKGRSAELSAGTCTGGLRCSMISWIEDTYHIKVIMRGGPFELITMAESMVSGSQTPPSLK